MREGKTHNIRLNEKTTKEKKLMFIPRKHFERNGQYLKYIREIRIGSLVKKDKPTRIRRNQKEHNKKQIFP